MRAYDAASGSLDWELELDGSGTRQDDFATNVTAGQGMVFVFSQRSPLINLPGCCAVGGWLLQAFDAASGQFLWERDAGPFETAGYDMVVHRGTLVVPGFAVDPTTRTWDWIVRVYDIRGAGIE